MPLSSSSGILLHLSRIALGLGCVVPNRELQHTTKLANCYLATPYLLEYLVNSPTSTAEVWYCRK